MIYKLSKTNTFFSRFEGTRGEKNQTFRTLGLAHDKTKLFECPTCKATYASAKTLNKHVAFVHNQNSGKDLSRNGRNIKIDPIFMVMWTEKTSYLPKNQKYSDKLI